MSVQTSRRRLFALCAGASIAMSLSGIARADDLLAGERSGTADALVSPDARNVVLAMGRSLSVEGFSFQSRTIREYADENGQPLHIFHTARVLVRRPNRLAVEVEGDDGAIRIAGNGTTLTIFNPTTNRYTTANTPGSIQETLRIAGERLHMDFPLADLLADNPGEAFLHDVMFGYVVGSSGADTHLFFVQPPGIELELWVDRERALPHRLIATYRSLPGEPRFIAEMSDWRMDLHPSDAAFELKLPADAIRVEVEASR